MNDVGLSHLALVANDHGSLRSVYSTDPNGISLEFTVAARDFVADPMFEDPDPGPAARGTI